MGTGCDRNISQLPIVRECLAHIKEFHKMGDTFKLILCPLTEIKVNMHIHVYIHDGFSIRYVMFELATD